MIKIKTEKEIKIMTEGGKKIAQILEKLKKKLKPGITTKELDKLAEKLISKSGGEPNFKGYEGFPATICTSINEEVVHCIPSERKLKKGDIVSLDIGMKYKGFHTDMAKTFPIGEISFETKSLIKITKKALKRGIKKTKIGNTIGDVSNTIQRYVETQKLGVIRELAGHGIGRDLHEDPQIPNFGKRHTGEKIKQGMVFCIEPMVTTGHWKLKEAEDGFGFKTKDNSLACHFEDMIAITKNGPIVLTNL